MVIISATWSSLRPPGCNCRGRRPSRSCRNSTASRAVTHHGNRLTTRVVSNTLKTPATAPSFAWPVRVARPCYHPRRSDMSRIARQCVRESTGGLLRVAWRALQVAVPVRGRRRSVRLCGHRGAQRRAAGRRMRPRRGHRAQPPDARADWAFGWGSGRYGGRYRRGSARRARSGQRRDVARTPAGGAHHRPRRRPGAVAPAGVPERRRRDAGDVDSDRCRPAARARARGTSVVRSGYTADGARRGRSHRRSRGAAFGADSRLRG